MATEVHLQTTVLPGHRIVLTDPSLPEGVEVSVTVKLELTPSEVSAIDFLESLPERRLYANAPEADAALRNERKSWD